MSLEKVRVRFAPSPTGPLHIGGVRTALYNYLFAKKSGGSFIIRIEDTDQTRFVEGAQEYIMESLKWCGIQPDEGPGFGGNYGPYIQSERKAMYKPFAEQLIQNDRAYYAFDTPEQLEEVREKAKQMNMPNWQYNSVTRASMQNSLTLPADEVKRRLENGDPYVVRIKFPRNTDIRFKDEIRGWVVVNTNNLDDKVLFKSDGMPTYHLANIVDDHCMEISHVIRGEEWLPSAPLHIFMYESFGWDAPKFAHLPLLLKPDGKGKLSKRDGDRLGFPVFPANWTSSEGEIYTGYREQGYFPDAFVNMLAFLGWNPGTPEEIFSLGQLAEAFSLDRVSKSGAKFDPDKTKWYQQYYLRHKTNEELLIYLKKEADVNNYSDKFLSAFCELMKERCTFVNEFLTEGAYLFNDQIEYDETTVNKKWNENAAELMKKWLVCLQAITSFNSQEIDDEFHSFMEKNTLKPGQAMPLFRLLITGKGMGPSLFAICELLGKEKCISRIEKGISRLSV
jgi:glutamyl-tRNA synthetase